MRMAPLSRELSGVILAHDSYGSHLNSQNKCIDTKLEKQNFAKAGKKLAELWSRTTIDKFPVIAEYKHPGDEAAVPESIDSLWYAEHVRESQYFLQVIKLIRKL